MLKVLQLIPTLDRSGAEKQMVLLAKGLPKDRFQVEVATLTRNGPLESELAAAGISITSITKRHKLDPWALNRLAQFMKSRRFDLVQTWIFAANTYGRVAARLAGVPIVVVSEMAVDLWKGKSERFFDRRLAGWCDRVVGNSHAVVDFYRKLGIPEKKLAMIYSGIEDEPTLEVDKASVRRELGFDREAPVILFAGRLAEQKRVGDLIKAVDLLQHIRPALRTIVAGDGPLRESIETMIHAYHLNDRVRLLGHRNDVPKLMAAADLVVLPSSYEGLPNLLLEAMRLAKPVVATEAPGTTEVVVNRQTGLLVPVGNPQLLAKAIREVIDDQALASRLAESGKARVESAFRLDTMIAKFGDLYEQLAREKGVLSS